MDRISKGAGFAHSWDVQIPQNTTGEQCVHHVEVKIRESEFESERDATDTKIPPSLSGHESAESVNSTIPKDGGRINLVVEGKSSIKHFDLAPRPLASPISRLPAETLAEIFEAYVRLQESPCRLALVCVQWRNISLHMPRLWSHLYLHDNRGIHVQNSRRWFVPGTGTIHTIGQKQLCRTPEEVDSAITRAGAMPLDIEVDFNHSYPVSGDLDKMFLKIFGTNDIPSRVECMRITQMHVRSSSLRSIPDPSFLILSKLVWLQPTWYCIPVIGRGLCQSKQLQSLNVGFTLVEILKDAEIWNGLRSLTLQGTGTGNFNSGSAIIDSVIAKCKSLEELKILDGHWPTDQTPIIRLNALRQVALNCEVRDLLKIHAPLLNTMQLVEVWKRSAIVSIEFPALATLKLRTLNPQWLYQSNIPGLSSLYLHLLRNRSLLYRSGFPLPGIFPENGLMAVRELTVEGIDDYHILIPLLKSVPNSQRITILPRFGMFDQFSAAVLQELSTKRGTTLAANAQSIQFGSGSFPVSAPKVSLEPRLRVLVASRQKQMNPLQSLKVHWVEENSATEYV
ncbi:hypothetical protein FRC17_004663 [Serendipita sp. 399]|nr:hypothetical protein FRC17_004663 [Serendipita sp. 399]